MMRKWSLYLGKISGIKLFVHWTFMILIVWIILSGMSRGYNAMQILLSLGFIMAIFVCIILHELGHALTAKRFNFKTRDIILLPIGGLARLEGLPEKPRQEFLVAIMGPAVNFAIVFVLFFALKVSGTMPVELSSAELTPGTFWYQILAVNFFLAVFNLIPAFPMDGGRILRALLATKLTRVKATRVAAYAGQFIAILFVFFGFFYNPFLAFIGLFVFLGAQAEAAMEETKARLGDMKAGDILMHRYTILQPNEPLSKAVSLLLDSQEESFIVKENGDVKGTLSKKEIINGLSKFGKDIAVEKVMETKVMKLHENDSLREIMLRFPENAHALMPVFDGEKLIGVLNLENINEYVQIQNALKESSHET